MQTYSREGDMGADQCPEEQTSVKMIPEVPIAVAN